MVRVSQAVAHATGKLGKVNVAGPPVRSRCWPGGLADMTVVNPDAVRSMMSLSGAETGGDPAKPARLRQGFAAAGRALAAAALGLVLLGSAAEAGGAIRPFSYHSAALDADRTAQVYVPAGDAPDDGWPVLYLLHGLHGHPADWASLGDLRATLDRMIDERQIKPLLVVMPDGSDSWYVDSAEVGGPGNYATAIGHDLQVAVEQAFPVGTDRLHRAVAGISMGGYGALRFGLAQPERYGAVAALSPAIWQNVPAKPFMAAGPDALRASPAYFQRADASTVTVGIDAPPDGRHFGTAFGTPFDPKRFNDANVFTLLEQDIEAKRYLPPIYLTTGDDDSHLLWRGAIAFFETMQADRRWMEFRVTNGDHNWALWRSSLVDAVAFVDRSLNKVPVR